MKVDMKVVWIIRKKEKEVMWEGSRYFFKMDRNVYNKEEMEERK